MKIVDLIHPSPIISNHSRSYEVVVRFPVVILYDIIIHEFSTEIYMEIVSNVSIFGLQFQICDTIHTIEPSTSIMKTIPENAHSEVKLCCIACGNLFKCDEIYQTEIPYKFICGKCYHTSTNVIQFIPPRK